MTRTGFLLAVLALTACGKPASAPDEVAGNDTALPATNDAAPASNAATPPTPPLAETPGAHPIAPEPAPIPAKFRGTWAESKAACADLEHHSRITISGRTIRHPDFVMVGDSVTASGSQFALKGRFEGTGRPAEAQYFINADGDVLTDGGGGGAVRVRCA